MDTRPSSPIALALEDAAGEVDIRGTRVLVVDDNPQNTELVQAYLESLPVQIATAVDGLDAMAQAERFTAGLAKEVSATPTFFINDQKLESEVPLAQVTPSPPPSRPPGARGRSGVRQT